MMGVDVQIMRLEQASTDMEFVCRSERDAAHVSGFAYYFTRLLAL